MKQAVALTLRLNPEIYDKAKQLAKYEGKSFTCLVQSLLEEKLKKEGKKKLFDAFSLIAEDRKEVDVDFAFESQKEVISKK